MDLDLHRLELRYERLRKQSPARERQLLGSLGELVQHLPSLVVAGGDDGRFVVVDGYKRVRALRRLGQALVRATLWDVSEVEALLLERLMRTADSDGPIEPGWLLRERQARFGMSLMDFGPAVDARRGRAVRRLAGHPKTRALVHGAPARRRRAAQTSTVRIWLWRILARCDDSRR